MKAVAGHAERFEFVAYGFHAVDRPRDMSR
jgi:hypothetical protein